MFSFVLLFALNCNFWHESYLKIFNFESTKVPGGPTTEEQKGQRREREQERQNDTPVIATPQIIFFDTKPFVISTDELFQVDEYF